MASKATFFVEILEDLDRDYFENLIRVNNDCYFDVVGSGDIYKADTYISINMDKLREMCKEDCIECCEDFHKEIIENCDEYDDIEDCKEFQIFYNEYCGDFINNIIDYHIEDIKSNFEYKGVRVVLYCDNYMINVGFYVSAEIHEDKTYVCFIENLKDIEKVEELKDLISYDTITLYYSLMEDAKEAEKAVKFIKELVA